MSPFSVDKRDIRFCLYEYLGLEELCRLPAFAEFNRELFDMVLDEAVKFSVDVLAPLNIVLDREGARFEDGRVTLPAACHDAYRALCEAGWVAPEASQEYGGQGLPFTLTAAIAEVMYGASPAFHATPGLAKSAGHVIEKFGTEALKKRYVEKLYAGAYGGTMCLTEPGAGSAVGDLKARAKKEGDHYRIEGEKIFITSAEHDLTENIVHLVLARTEGAPKGIKGVSLFLVPKLRPGADGSPGEPNHVVCGGIEHKMGLHGSPSCTMIFGGDGPCHGWLIGEENQGIRYMFQMMNEARIGVGLQGLSASAFSYLEALAYARERIQGVEIHEMRNVDAPRVPILKHPDVRRNLLTMKAMTEGMRAMIYFAAKCADLAERSQDEDERGRAQHLLDLLTPICKAYCSDQGYLMTVLGIQVLGGYGYTREFPLEQCCRDSKPASIYEGTNGIQALDLLGRKVAGKGAAAFMTFMMQLNDFIDRTRSHAFAGPWVEKLERARFAMTEVVMEFQKTGASGDMTYPVLCATPFLEMAGHIVMSYFLIDMAVVAEDRLSKIHAEAGAKTDQAKRRVCEDNPEAAYYDGKLHSMRFFVDTYLPQAHAIAESIKTGNRSALDVVF